MLVLQLSVIVVPFLVVAVVSASSAVEFLLFVQRSTRLPRLGAAAAASSNCLYTHILRLPSLACG